MEGRGMTVTTEQKYMLGAFVHHLCAKVGGYDFGSVDPTADPFTVAATMDKYIDAAMNKELTIRQLLDIAVATLKEMSEQDASR